MVGVCPLLAEDTCHFLAVDFDEDQWKDDARRLGTAITSYTRDRRRQLQLTSNDRLFPRQDRLPKGGFGNLIALLLQRAARPKPS